MNKYTDQDHRFASLRKTLNANRNLLGQEYEKTMNEIFLADSETESMKFAIMTGIAKDFIRRYAHLVYNHNRTTKLHLSIYLILIIANIFGYINE